MRGPRWLTWRAQWWRQGVLNRLDLFDGETFRQSIATVVALWDAEVREWAAEVRRLEQSTDLEKRGAEV